MKMRNFEDARRGQRTLLLLEDHRHLRTVLDMERIVAMYLAYAENQAARQIPMRMGDWVAKLDAFLTFNEYDVLTNAGSVSAEVAKRLAEERYATFRVQQDRSFESDFEKETCRSILERTVSLKVTLNK